MRVMGAVARAARLVLALLLAVGALTAAAEAEAVRDDKDKTADFHIIELPSMDVILPRNDGSNGYRHIVIDAYILPKDELTGQQLDGVKTSIVKFAVEQTLPAAGYERLHMPHGGSEVAKSAFKPPPSRLSAILSRVKSRSGRFSRINRFRPAPVRPDTDCRK